jgi:hypothetical protein
MEDYLKILRAEYLSNDAMDHTPILYSYDKPSFVNPCKKQTSNGRWSTNIKVEYLSKHLLDPTHILKLSLDYQTILYESFIWRWPPMEDDLRWKTTSKYITVYCIILKF